MIRWKPFINSDGLLSPDGNATGNGLMYTAEYIWWLAVTAPQGAMEEVGRITTVYESCWVDGGGFNRAPSGHYSKHLNQADDYYGIAFASMLLNEDYSARVLKVARNNWGVLNNLHPGVFKWKSWLFRHPGLKATLRLSAGETLGPYAMAMFTLTLLVSLFKFKHRDSRIKAFFMVKVAEGKSGFLDAVCKLWMWRFKKKFDGLGHAEYFSGNHPVRLLMWDWT